MRLTCFSNQSIESNESNDQSTKKQSSSKNNMTETRLDSRRLLLKTSAETVFLKARVSYNARLWPQKTSHNKFKSRHVHIITKQNNSKQTNKETSLSLFITSSSLFFLDKKSYKQEHNTHHHSLISFSLCWQQKEKFIFW